MLQGETRPVADPRIQELYRVHYNPTYDWDFNAEQVRQDVYSFRPQRGFAWLDDHGEDFAKTGTRFTFDGWRAPPARVTECGSDRADTGRRSPTPLATAAPSSAAGTPESRCR